MKNFFLIAFCLFSFTCKIFSSENDSTKNNQVIVSGAPFYLGVGAGINNTCGMIGVLGELQIHNNLAFSGGLGIGGWGTKASIGLRIYRSYPGKLFYGLGFSTASGLKNYEYDIETTRSSKEKVTFNLIRVNLLTLNIGYQWRIGNASRFNIEFGYDIPLQSKSYDIVTSGVQLTENSKSVMNMVTPGGLKLGIGFTFGLGN